MNRSMSNVANSLNALFEQHRLIFWYDPEGEMREEFDGYPLEDGEKVEVNNNQFGLKYRMAREESDKRFLVYIPSAQPAHSENWFLDLELAHHRFTADRTSLILQEMEWLTEHRPFVEEYATYFKSKSRRQKLKEKLRPDDSEQEWKLAMLGVCAKEEPILESILFSLLAEVADRETAKWEAIEKYGLEFCFWDEIGRKYDYWKDAPTLLDLAIEIFLAAAPCGKSAPLGSDAVVFLKRWKDNARYADAFAKLSARLQGDLRITEALDGLDGIDSFKNQDAFEAIEQKIIVEIRDGLLNGTMSLEQQRNWVESRESSFWFTQYRHLYGALQAAGDLLAAIRQIDLNFDTPQQAIENYTNTYHEIDQLYRHYGFHAAESQQATLLDSITDEVERRYVNEYLLQLNDRFQGQLDELEHWPVSDIPYQRQFYKNHVEPVLQQGNKLFVIISDALRFEAGKELHERILKEDKFRSTLGHQLSVLPSYTQLGMAALLPHEELEIEADNAGVFADGQRTQGLEARAKILAAGKYRGTAVKATDFLGMNAKEEGRDLFKKHDVIYIYQNGIDSTGDKTATEGETFQAVDREFDTILKILKKMASINGSNAVITADHGFLFQLKPIDESDFTANPKGDDIGTTNRRFALAKSFDDMTGAKIFSAENLGLKGGISVAIPKSINRFRIKGAGSRFVHGGAALQEIVLPVLTVNKSRASDIEVVDVDIIREGSNLITTAKFLVALYQSQPVADKKVGRELRVGFYAADGTLISDRQTLTFGSSDESPRNRERKINFTFDKSADAHQGEEIFLIMEEQIPGTDRYNSYKKETYRFKKTFESDFEL